MKVSELHGALLDYWVARAEGKRRPVIMESEDGPDECLTDEVRDGFVLYNPSYDRDLGGPIVERERIATWHGANEWFATHPAAMPSGYGADSDYIDVTRDESYSGATLLTAAMCAYVAARFGQDVPDNPMADFGEKP